MSIRILKRLTETVPISKLTIIIMLVGAILIGFLFGIIYRELAPFAQEQEQNSYIPIIKNRAIKDQIGSWKAYANDILGFSLQYPSNYKIKEDLSNKTGAIIFSSPDLIWTEYPEDNVPQKGVYITIEIGKNKLSIAGNAYAEYIPTLISSRETNLDDAKATYTIKDHLSEARSHTVSAKKNNRQFTLTALFSKQDEKDVVNMFQKLLSTFKFTTP